MLTSFWSILVTEVILCPNVERCLNFFLENHSWVIYPRRKSLKNVWWTPLLPPSHPPFLTSGNHQAIQKNSFQNVLCVEGYVTFWGQLFPLDVIPWTFIQVAVCTNSLFLLLLNSIPWYACTVICLTIHLWKDSSTVSRYWLLKIKLL